MVETEELDRLVGRVEATGLEMRAVPDGWPGNVELSLIDAVLSIRARYGVSADTGVRGAIKRYKTESGRTKWDDLGALAKVDAAWLEGVLENRQKTGGAPKAEAIISAAGRLAQVGLVTSKDVDRNSAEQRKAYCGTRGLGPVTWQYFLILVGHDGVKPDTLVTRFVETAIGRKPDARAVTGLVTDAAKRLGVPAAALDHSIWRHMSNTRRE